MFSEASIAPLTLAFTIRPRVTLGLLVRSNGKEHQRIHHLGNWPVAKQNSQKSIWCNPTIAERIECI